MSLVTNLLNYSNQITTVHLNLLPYYLSNPVTHTHVH